MFLLTSLLYLVCRSINESELKKDMLELLEESGFGLSFGGRISSLSSHLTLQ